MLFDTHLTEDFDALRDTVKRMCDTELAPRASEIDRANEFPADMWAKLGEMGLLGMTVPEQYGGTGLGYVAHIVASNATREINRSDVCSSARVLNPRSPVPCVGVFPHRLTAQAGSLPSPARPSNAQPFAVAQR